ncbi:Pentatricopeptide repeat-containing protein 2, mitochondrial [Chionoecetes opilio]|uniref:Pentatricopeptide repeat-containing protein 2, mitochondrial n=1 Tax=Chionoecetes opilio TaxID=41210 RepID=A0A8J5CS73_CHIOP|nr:Pentatricopeptide repeat-containing protein 2, mitochondrial [Chionoecetes opilio]
MGPQPGPGVRHLYTPAALNLDHYARQREETSVRFANIETSFKARMKELLAAQGKAMIFTEDFKNALHLAEDNEEDMGLVREMSRRFNRQHEGLRFGMYIFGPVVMRTYHTLKQPQEALEALHDPELCGFFDQLVSHQVAMDLLYKAERYPQKLKDLTCAHEYAVAVSNRFDVLGALEDPVELWDTFKRETLQAAKECIGELPRARRGFVSTETLENIEESHAAMLAGKQDQHRALSRRTRTLLGRDKKRHVSVMREST